jgi:uncharacterized repeat protein (TIGR02543 family)
MSSFTLARILVVLILSTLLAFIAGTLFAAQVTLTWDTVTGQSISGYKIYYGTASRNYTTSVDAKNVTSFPVSGLQDGTTYYFAATVYNAAKAESGFSNEVTYTTPPTCTYSLSSNSASFGAAAGTGSVTVTAPGGCGWSSSSVPNWITVTAGSTGTGTGTFRYSVAANTTTSSRTAALTIAGNVYTVTQAGVSTSYTITASAGTGGSISPSGSVTVAQGSSKSFTISPNSGYTIADVKADGVSVGAVTSYTFSNVTANHTIAATFAATTYTLSVSKAGTGTGTVTTNPSGTSFAQGTSVTLTATPNTNSTFMGWSGACSGTSTTCTVTMNGNTSLTASFAAKIYNIITASAGIGGSISPSGSVAVGSGASQAFTISSASGYTIADVKLDGVSVGAVTSYTFSNVTANHTISATFNVAGYTITASATAGGNISPAGTVNVTRGSNQTFAISRYPGYTLADVKVDGVSVGKVTSYTFSNVTANHTIAASFAQ